MTRPWLLLAPLIFACTPESTEAGHGTSPDTALPPPEDTADTGDTGETSPRPAPRSLLVNGDAEACSVDGWVLDVDGTIDAVGTQEEGDDGVVEPVEGACFFSFARAAVPGDDHALRQDGNVEPHTVLLLTGQVRTRAFEYATARLVVEGPAGVLTEASTGPLRPADWSPFQLALLAPEGAVQFQLELRAHLESGSFTNVYFDDLTLIEEAL